MTNLLEYGNKNAVPNEGLVTVWKISSALKRFVIAFLKEYDLDNECTRKGMRFT